jgi:hypothetical protein
MDLVQERQWGTSKFEVPRTSSDITSEAEAGCFDRNPVDSLRQQEWPSPR